MAQFQHSAEYLRDRERRKACRVLADGIERLRSEAEAGYGMWPRHGEMLDAYAPEESPIGGRVTRWKARLRESTIRNVWSDAVREGALSPFRHQIQLDGWSEEVEAWQWYIGGGKTLPAYMRTSAVNKAVDGIHLTLVELPSVRDDDGEPVERTLGADRRAGIRPYWVPILADHFDPLDVTPEGVLLAGAVYLTLGRPEGWRPGRDEDKRHAAWRLYEATKEGVIYTTFPLEEADPDADVDDKEISGPFKVAPLGSNTLDEIPIVPFYADWSLPAYRAAPPFADAADVQMGAWRKRSDKDNQARKTARSRAFQSGVNVDESGNPRQQFQHDVIWSESPQADAKILETSGAALKALREDLEDDEEHIRQACRSIRARRTTGEITATEIGMVGLMTSSYQEAVVVGDTHSIRKTLELTELLGGLAPSGGTVSWRHDAFSSVSRETLDRVFGAVKEGILPLEAWLRLETRGGGLPEDYGADEVLKLIGGPPGSGD